ncbi:MAG: radical SAM protein [Candidatus Gorgyraea atricola]|nr:radical SAM protein [Candidatus Gorgyraea atricola]
MTFCERYFLGFAKRFILRHALLKRACLFFLVQKPVTRLLKPPFTRTSKIIAIDITYVCNLKCNNCVRSCKQAPTSQRMTVEQIKKFIKESIENNNRWERIRLMGGEPTLHPDLLKIVQLLLEYKKKYSPEAVIEVVTNGHGKTVNNILSKLPKDIEISNSAKDSPMQEHFLAFNIAPRDLKHYRFADYSVGCRGMTVSGMGLTPYGYYPCAVSGGIDRIFGFNIGRKKLPLDDDSMKDQREKFCQYCGRFRGMGGWVKEEVMSPTWKNAYASYKSKKPTLSLY